MYHQINNIQVKVIQGTDGIYKVFPVSQGNNIFPICYGNGTSEKEALWHAKNNIYNSQSLLNNVLSIENNKIGEQK